MSSAPAHQAQGMGNVLDADVFCSDLHGIKMSAGKGCHGILHKMPPGYDDFIISFLLTYVNNEL